jgi:hypothetical protein
MRPTKDSEFMNNLEFEEVIKSLMLKVNICFLHKQWSESFVIEAVKGISK